MTAIVGSRWPGARSSMAASGQRSPQRSHRLPVRRSSRARRAARSTGSRQEVRREGELRCGRSGRRGEHRRGERVPRAAAAGSVAASRSAQEPPPTRAQSQAANSGTANRSTGPISATGTIAPSRRRVSAPSWCADDMEDHGVVRGIEVVPVIAPAPGPQVDLDAAGAQFASGEEDQRIAEIRTETVTPGAAVDDLQATPSTVARDAGTAPLCQAALRTISGGSGRALMRLHAVEGDSRVSVCISGAFPASPHRRGTACALAGCTIWGGSSLVPPKRGARRASSRGATVAPLAHCRPQ